ncbi:hypothetical protein ACEWGJ_03025 [Vibrio diabolicus]|uniref:hypothetical protein n=1 Tax=Vibrio diabolicus TaxID=50719 RepID=UPI0035A92B4D
MFKIHKPKSKDESIEEVTAVVVEEPHKHPMICLFDFEEDVEKELENLRFNYVTASFGSTVKVANKRHEEKLLKLNHDYPSNLHEFDIVMLDLTVEKSEDFDASLHSLKNTTGNKAHALLSIYPEQVFDPRPLSINIVSDEINELAGKKAIVIAFCGSAISSEYQFVEITAYEASITRRESYSNHTFYKGFSGSRNRHGRKVALPEKGSKLSPLFNQHLDGIEYRSVFNHPDVWEDGKYQKDRNFIPLLLNERDEIVSYAHFQNESLVLVFPDIENKGSFVASLLKTYLPEIMPDIFPFHGEFGWLESGDYLLPGESELLQEKADIEEKYVNDITENENSLLKLKSEFKFLTDLISETGDALVSSIEHYLKWLEFESVVNFDDTNPDILEEDIQVDCGDRFLVIEIKGIGGTSTDKDCSQISKIRYRRAEQRGKFDVFGLYIVNHQRYMPPKSRSNPPFTENQVKDAGHDKRGLLTTYDLYKAYFLIEDGILQKSDVRESLFKTGLITLEPTDLVSIGVPQELFMNGQVAIVNLNDITLAVGDTLIVRKQGDYSRAKVESLQVNGKGVDTCNEGEVGIKLDRKLKKNSELFVRKL